MNILTPVTELPLEIRFRPRSLFHLLYETGFELKSPEITDLLAIAHYTTEALKLIPKLNSHLLGWVFFLSGPVPKSAFNTGPK